MDESLNKAIRIIVDIASPEKIILFGSRAVGKGRKESDYDLLVIKKRIKNKRELSQKIYRNFTNIGAPVDVIVVGFEKYEELKNDPYLIYSEADKHGIVVYEQH